MPSKHFSIKHLQIDKATARMIAFTAIAAAVLVFSLVSAKAMIAQQSYQSKVIGLKEKAKTQLENNIAAKDQLVASYQEFVSRQENIIGGNAQGEGENDGDNARIILDALPSKYDFPALATSLEKMVSTTAAGVQIQSINGTDDELAQSAAVIPDPIPIEIPFQLTVSGTFGSLKALTRGFERSVRPFNITKLSLSGSSSSLSMNLTAKTYYQPEKQVTVQLRSVK